MFTVISISSLVYAQYGQEVGTVVKVTSNIMIIRNADPNEPLQIGEKLYIIVDNQRIGLTVLYPMQTSTRCKMSFYNKSIIKSITQGIPVYRVNDSNDITTENTTITPRISVFKDNGNGTITDTRSKLIWLKNANQSGKMMTFEEAESWVRTLDVSGMNKWRIPTKKEIEFLCKSNLDDISDNFDDIQTNKYWTSTPFLTSNGGIVCDLSSGISRNTKKNNRAHILPVLDK